jgi:hypothetical protein
VRILSWNAFGGNTAALAAAIAANNIDLCVLQEAKRNGNSSWYTPLRQQLPNYGLHVIPENQSIRAPNWPMSLPPADSQIRAYALLWHEATVLPLASELIDYTRDGVWGPPGRQVPNRQKAAEEGYNQRPPLKLELEFGGHVTTVFTWHAPLGLWNAWTLNMFEKSQTLANAVGPRGGAPGRTVIAADLNNPNVHPYFSKFEGLQQANSRIDYIIANTTLAKVVEIPGINLQAGFHWAMAADVTW